MLSGFKQLLTNSRLRSLIILFGTLLGIIVIVIVYQASGVGDTAKGSAALPRAATAGTQTDIVDAQKLSPEYMRALLQSEQTTTQKALKTGQSAVGSFIEAGDVGQLTSGATDATNGEACSAETACATCCAQKSATSLTNKWLQGGQITPAVASTLSKLNDQNLAVGDYAAKLSQLVKEGKLTPEQAKELLTAYRQQHHAAEQVAHEKAMHAANDAVNELVATGAMTADVANKLESLSKTCAPINSYEKQLRELRTNGDLDEQTAAKLLDAYHTQFAVKCRITAAGEEITAAGEEITKSGAIKVIGPRHATAARAPDSVIAQMVKEGLSPAVAQQLKDIEGQSSSAADYATNLNRLVREGKITPAQAEKLLAAYRATHGDTSVSGTTPEMRELQSRQQEEELKAQEAQMSAQRQAQQEQEAMQQAQQTQSNVDAVQGAMDAQAHALLASWNVEPQTYRYTALPEGQSGSSAQGNGHNGSAAGGSGAANAPLVKAGTIMFGTLDTAVNSDYPGPVMATIVSGSLKGAKLIGSISKVSVAGADRLTLQFQSISMDQWPDVVSISAVAINPDTAYTAMASSVNHHYLERYGTLFAASFLQGYASALTSAGGTVVNTASGTSQTSPVVSPRGRIMVGLGKVGDNLQSTLQKNIDRPPTVKIDAGVGIGIMFTTTVQNPSFSK